MARRIRGPVLRGRHIAARFRARFLGGPRGGFLRRLAHLLDPGVGATQIVPNLGRDLTPRILEDRDTFARVCENTIHRVLQQLHLRQRQITRRAALFERLQTGQCLFIVRLDCIELVLGELLDAIVDCLVG